MRSIRAVHEAFCSFLYRVIRSDGKASRSIDWCLIDVSYISIDDGYSRVVKKKVRISMSKDFLC